jgi:hypothetical protein
MLKKRKSGSKKHPRMRLLGCTSPNPGYEPHYEP